MPQTNPDVQRFNLLRRFSDARRSEHSRFPLPFPLPVVLFLYCAIGARRPEFGRAKRQRCMVRACLLNSWCLAARIRPGQMATLYGARLPAIVNWRLAVKTQLG